MRRQQRIWIHFPERDRSCGGTLAKTPEMLPVLKEAGVVDSGGQGLLEVYHGAYDGFLGKEIDYTQFDKAKGPAVTKIDAQTEADINLVIVQSLLFF